MTKEKILKKLLILLTIAMYAVEVILFYHNNSINTIDCITLFVLMGLFVFGFSVVKYRQDIWIMLGICIMDYIFVDAQAVGNMRIDGNELTFFLNVFFIFLVFYFLYQIFQNFKAATCIIQIFVLIIGVVNYYLVDLRGRGLYVSDLLSIRTVLNVVDQYTLKINYSVIYSIVCILVIHGIVPGIIKPQYEFQNRMRWKKTLGTVLVGILLYNANVLGVLGHQVYWWAHSAINGFFVGFILQAENYATKASSEYSADNIVDLEEEYKGGENQESRNPDVIVIMNESFSDLSVINKIETNMDYMPYFHSLDENCVKGNLYVSVKGGNTANTEYEFLTGDTMGFFDYGQVVYNSYINRNIESNVSHVKKCNYEAYAFHPWLRSG